MCHYKNMVVYFQNFRKFNAVVLSKNYDAHRRSGLVSAIGWKSDGTRWKCACWLDCEYADLNHRPSKLQTITDKFCKEFYTGYIMHKPDDWQEIIYLLFTLIGFNFQNGCYVFGLARHFRLRIPIANVPTVLCSRNQTNFTLVSALI